MAARHTDWMMMAGLILLLVVSVGCDSQPPSPGLSVDQLVARVRRGDATEIVAAGVPIGDEELQLIGTLSRLEHLAIEEFVGTAKGLEDLVQLPALERLQLRGKEIDDEAMAAIANCSKLKNLNLPDARFSNVGLASLRSLSHLELLRFRSPNVTDDGLAEIAQMQSLRFLHLIGVPITDEGLAHLESMKQLESLYLDDALVSEDGIGRLLEALPELHFHINQRHSDRDPAKGTHPH